MSEKSRLEAIVHGFVQGVGFRHYTRRKASTLGVRGYVRNRQDGTVKVVAEGERDRLETLERWLHEGPPSARVELVNVQWGRAGGEFDRFEVRF